MTPAELRQILILWEDERVGEPWRDARLSPEQAAQVQEWCQRVARAATARAHAARSRADARTLREQVHLLEERARLLDEFAAADQQWVDAKLAVPWNGEEAAP